MLGYLVRRISLVSLNVTTLAGNPAGGAANGYGTAASFNHPSGVAMDANGSFALVVRVRERARSVRAVFAWQ